MLKKQGQDTTATASTEAGGGRKNSQNFVDADEVV